MIRYYTYYSFGGYRDLYIGSDKSREAASYFIPLINVWKKQDKSENAEKIARAESVKHVELITLSNLAGFPEECRLMFSHGGYMAIYRTLLDGRTCLCIRDIHNNSKDEEGRDIPFNFLFLAYGKESVDQLDSLALRFLSDGDLVKNLIAAAISYDPIINGLKFSLNKLNSLFSATIESTLNHRIGTIDYIMIGSQQYYANALSEQGIRESQVVAAIDSSGLFYGKIANRALQNAVSDNEMPHHRGENDNQSAVATPNDATLACSTIDNSMSIAANESSQPSSKDKPQGEQLNDRPVTNQMVELKSAIEMHGQAIHNALLTLYSKSDSERLYSILQRLSADNDRQTNAILEAVKQSGATSDEVAVIPILKIVALNFLRSSKIIIALVSLIVGFALGILLF